MSATYSCQLYDRAADVDPDEWSRVTDISVNPSMDLRFLGLLNSGLGDSCRAWAAIIRNENGEPVGATYFSTYSVDGALFLPKFLVPPTNLIRRLWSRYLHLKFAICGHPIGIGKSSLQLVEGVDHEQVAIALEQTASQIAKDAGAHFILFKEYNCDEAANLGTLISKGYAKQQSVVTYTMQTSHTSFDEYYNSRSKRTRANMRKYLASLEAADMTVEYKRGAAAAKEFTNDVYELYRNVLDQAAFRFEVMPPEFFHQLAELFKEEACFTYIRDANGIHGFCCGLGNQSHHMLLYCGINYARNDEASIYFNTLYRGLAPAFESRVSSINVGQSADEFKKRLGCEPTPLFIFLKPVGRLLRVVSRPFLR